MENLDDLMILVFGGAAVEAEGAGVAVQAEHVAFAPGGVAVGAADVEEGGVEELLQPRRHRHCVRPLPQPQPITFSLYPSLSL